MSCCKEKKEPSDVPLQTSPEVELWMEMMKYMLECAELTMAAIREAKQKLKFSHDDMVRFNDLCLTVEKVRKQLVSVGENFLIPLDPRSTSRTKSIPKPALIKRKSCCMQADEDPLDRNKKKVNIKKNACYCGKYKKKIVDKSKNKKIVVCSPAKNSVFLNQKCSRSFEIPKESSGEPGIPQDVEENHPYIIKDHEKCNLPEHGVGYEFFCAMTRYNDRIAQYIDDTGEEQTFGELLKDSVSVALNLKKNNIGKDDVVCICVSNHKYSCVPYIAAAFACCQLTALDVNLSLSEIDHLLEFVRPKIMFVQKETLPLVEGSVQKNNIETEIVVVGGDVDRYVPFEEYLNAADDEVANFKPEKVNSMGDTFIILYSSGTTEDPKGVQLSHHSMLKQFTVALSTGNFHKVILYYSSYYTTMTSIFLGASILGGTTRVIASNFDPEGMYRTISKYKVESAFLGSHDCITLTRTPKPEDADTSSLKVLSTRGSCLKSTYLQKLRSLFPETFVFQVYGQTEVCGLVLLWSTNDRQHVALFNAKPESSGMPCGGTFYKIVEEKSGKILGPNQKGELCVKTDAVMKGYLNRDSSDILDKSGWLRTGDIAYYDEYHCFYIIDKLTEVINVKGKPIPRSKLENILMEHPLVDIAVVFALPGSNETSNEEEVTMGFILPKPTVDPDTVDRNEILEYVNKQVDEEEFLKGGIIFVEEIPLTVTGKVKRKHVKETLLRENEKKIFFSGK